METNGLMLNVGPNCLCIVLTLQGIAVPLDVITVIPRMPPGKRELLFALRNISTIADGFGNLNKYSKTMFCSWSSSCA